MDERTELTEALSNSTGAIRCVAAEVMRLHPFPRENLDLSLGLKTFHSSITWIPFIQLILFIPSRFRFAFGAHSR
jgi:hypothetical protein